MSTIKLRLNDIDIYGHANNAVYISFIQLAFAEAIISFGFHEDFEGRNSCYWSLKSIALEYRKPAYFFDDLYMNLWMDTPDFYEPVIGCEIYKNEGTPDVKSTEIVCRSISRWSKIKRSTNEILKIPVKILDGLSNKGGTVPKKFELPSDTLICKKYIWTHKVSVSEVDPNYFAHSESIYNWLQEAVFNASNQAGWSIERRSEVDFITYQTRHDTEFIKYPQFGDQIQVISSAIEVRKFRGTWLHEIYKVPDNELLVRDYSTGIFMDLNGRPTIPNPEMMRDIQFG
jgi:acyl-CoA thioesterase FadM